MPWGYEEAPTPHRGFIAQELSAVEDRERKAPDTVTIATSPDLDHFVHRQKTQFSEHCGEVGAA